MSPIDLVLQKLADHGLKRSGQGRWVCRCPAHEDRSPSLSITEGDDGRVLLHCFAGCDIERLCGAMAIDITELFPPRDNRPGHGGKGMRRARITYLQALQLIKQEVYVVWVAAQNLAAGHQLTPEDLKRLGDVTDKITNAMQEAGV